MEGGCLLIILYEIVTFNAKKFLMTSCFERKNSWFPDFLDLTSAWQTELIMYHDRKSHVVEIYVQLKRWMYKLMLLYFEVIYQY